MHTGKAMRGVIWTIAVVTGLMAVVLFTGPARTADTPEPADPYVLLDTAKLKLGEGRLPQALDLLDRIAIEETDGYIAEEVLFQQMLINSAFLSATHYMYIELARSELAESAYGGWLAAERDGYAAAFAAGAEDYLARTREHGPQLDFVRFRLPLVTVEHLADLELYSDPEILAPAVKNWDDGREGLGKGLIAGQARVALVLAAARYYDRAEASKSLVVIGDRLHSGVPLNHVTVLDWIAETAARIETDDGLRLVARQADEYLLEYSSALEEGDLRIRADARLNINNGAGEASE